MIYRRRNSLDQQPPKPCISTGWACL
uniref:Uncharacterized protein n=1 Tax=Lepeophtheirus salmonis TaxID=72036 RepID=A0A0K2VDQ3_LEPSM